MIEITVFEHGTFENAVLEHGAGTNKKLIILCFDLHFTAYATDIGREVARDGYSLAKVKRVMVQHG